MLGIRRVGEIALDLWCGEPETFVTDRTVSMDDSASLADLLGSGLNLTGSKIHIGIVLGAQVAPVQIVQQSIQFLNDPAIVGKIRRMTLITSELSFYKQLQAALFAEMPDFEKD